MATPRRKAQPPPRRGPLTRNERVHRAVKKFAPNAFSEYEETGAWPKGQAPYVFDTPAEGLVRLRVESDDGDATAGVGKTHDEAIAALERKLNITGGA